MLARHVVPITPALPVRLAPLLGYKQNEQTNFHFRTLFQVPYPVSPVFATLTKTPGVWGYSSHSGTHLSVAADSMRAMSAFQSLLLTTATGSLTARPSGCTDPIRVTTTPALSPLPATLMDLPCKCCKQKTYCLAKLFRCNTYKKEGWGCLFREHRTSPRGRKTRHSQGRSLRAYPLFPVHYPLSRLLYILTSLPLSFSHQIRI